MKSKGKYLVIGGFVIIIIIMIKGLMIIYKNLDDFSQRILADEDRRELIIVGNIINNLYEIEGVYNLLAFDSAKEYIEKYDSIRPLVSLRLDTLNQLSVDSNRITMLDSIEVLLDEKSENLIAIHNLMDSVNKAPTIDREVSSTYIPPGLNKRIADFLKERDLGPEEGFDNITDTTVIKSERKGLFRRLGDAIVGRQDSTVILQNRAQAVVQKEFELVVDTVINMVRYSERLNLDRQKRFQNALLKRQADMSQTNQVLTNKIDNLLKIIEKEEIEAALLLIAERDSVLNRSYKTVFQLSVVALFIAFLFAALFILDFNKVQRTKNRLEASNKKINQLLKSREKLMLAVSHDIKAPMSSILGYLELMESNKSEDNARDYRTNMKKSGEHILELVTSLLDLHHIESGTWTHNNIEYNVSDVINLTADSFRPAAKQKKLKLNVVNKVPENLVAFGEPFMMRLIFSNLISNAIKYTPKGKIDVEAVYDEMSEKLHFIVADTGIGIKEEDQKVIFDEFTQISSENPDEYIEGSGLGLAITKGLIDQLNGEIGMQSQKGKGTKFTVDLPVVLFESGDKSDVTIRKKESFNLKDSSVLVIDDDKIQLAMIAEMLKKEHIQVVTESDTAKVIQILKDNSFNIIFVDIQMPEKNGFVLVDEMINSGSVNSDNTSFIALTAHSDITLNEFEKAGFNDFLNKPFTSGELYLMINKHLNNSIETDIEKHESTAGIGVRNLIEVVKEDQDTSLEILNAFVTEAKPLYNILERINSGESENAAYFAHKMLPLFKMMKDDKLASILEKIDKKDSLTDLQIEDARTNISYHISQAKSLIAELEK